MGDGDELEVALLRPAADDLGERVRQAHLFRSCHPSNEKMNRRTDEQRVRTKRQRQRKHRAQSDSSEEAAQSDTST